MVKQKEEKKKEKATPNIEAAGIKMA